MTEISQELLERLSYSAEQWAIYLESKVQEGKAPSRDSIALAFGRVRREIYTIVSNELNRAISSTDEFQRPMLKGPLVRAFKDDSLVKVTTGGEIYFNTEEAAGGWDDFWDGVNYARSVFDTGKPRTPEQKANFWRVMVYSSYTGGLGGDDEEYDPEGMDADEDLWSKTIALRNAGGWAGLAPYWLILEHGNKGNDYAYPQNDATNFLYHARLKAQSIFNMTLNEVELEASNKVTNALNDFINDPEKYPPYAVLDEFYAEGRRYYVYVTSTKLIGVALPETFRGLQRRYG